MNTKKPRQRLQTIPEFLTLRPQYTEDQVRYAIRNRKKFGLADATFRRATGRRDILLDPARYAAHLAAVVPA
jgi:hypothetical protein